MSKSFPFLILTFCLFNFGFTQNDFFIQNKRQTDKIKFKFINNLIIIPVEVNGVPLSFILDSGVSKPIIFNFLNMSETLKIRNTTTIFLRGLGDGESVKALKSTNNIFKIGAAVNSNQDLFAVFDTDLNFAPRLGIPIHGIIGYDFFKSMVIEINYVNKYLRLTSPKKFRYKKCKSCETFNLEFYNNKPYLNAEAVVKNHKKPLRLLIDTGGSDALWLFEDNAQGIGFRKPFFNDFLGYGLSGNVYGKRSKIESFSLKRFQLKNINVAFPDSSDISYARRHKNRNGSIAGHILKRFHIIFDYQRAILTIKKNKYYKEAFTYNRSGIEVVHDGSYFVKELDDKHFWDASTEDLDANIGHNHNRVIIDPRYKISLKPAYAIVALRLASPAKNAGLLVGDIILNINGKASHNFSLQQLIQMFYDDNGKEIRLKVDRDGQVLTFTFNLKSPL